MVQISDNENDAIRFCGPSRISKIKIDLKALKKQPVDLKAAFEVSKPVSSSMINNDPEGLDDTSSQENLQPTMPSGTTSSITKVLPVNTNNQISVQVDDGEKKGDVSSLASGNNNIQDEIVQDNELDLSDNEEQSDKEQEESNQDEEEQDSVTQVDEVRNGLEEVTDVNVIATPSTSYVRNFEDILIQTEIEQASTGQVPMISSNKSAPSERMYWIVFSNLLLVLY